MKIDKVFDCIKFNDLGLIPAIIQDYKSKEVLTLCYMNNEALRKTLEDGKVYVFRRSKGRLMLKGETSGCIQKVKSLSIDCEGNSLLFKVRQCRAACHEGFFTCYYRKLDKSGRFKIVGSRVFDPSGVYK
ncbi:MAG: phosphoribosyl-AMP cyclohydrolase [Candidatus Omnitrophota bacterium]|nr:phosphoribosyl-AMP cyclohydrolase [Candidatus Omnitrophota bacterium]